MSALVCCTGAPEALQHPNHADREREHGAGGERESREKEERPQDWISKLPISLLIEFDCCCLPQAFITSFTTFFPIQAQKRKSEGTPDGRGRKKKLKL